MFKAVLVSILFASVLSTPTPTPAPQQDEAPEVNATDLARGRYYGHGGHGHDNGYHSGDGWGWGPSQDSPLIDDYICDVDATILVVTNADSGRDNGYGKDNGRDQGRDNGRDGYGGHDSGRDQGYGGGYGKHNGGGYGGYENDGPNADRLKCSVIASDDNDSCQTCCQLAARRDRSISKTDIVGFVVDDDQIDRTQNDYGNNNNGPYRAKRGASPPGFDDSNSGKDYRRGNGGHDHGRWPQNPLCVCCAPRQFGARPFFGPRHHRRGGY